MSKQIPSKRLSNLGSPSRNSTFSNMKSQSLVKRTPFHEMVQTDLEYQKTYYCGSFQELDLIRIRSNIKNHYLPKFQIIHQSSNFLTVKMMRYQFSGLEQIIRNWHNSENTKNLIISLLKTVCQLQIKFGSFQISDQKLRSNSVGNIVIWISEDFEQCFPVCPQNMYSQDQDHLQSDSRMQYHLERFKFLITRVNQKKSAKIDIKTLNHLFSQIKNILLFNIFNKRQAEESSNFRVKNLFSSSKKPHFKSQGDLKALFKPQKVIYPYGSFSPSTNPSPVKQVKSAFNSIKSSQMEKQNAIKHQRFSHFEGNVRQYSKFSSPPRFLNTKMSDEEPNSQKAQAKINLKRLRSPKMKYFPEDFNPKVPNFIKQRQKTKGDFSQTTSGGVEKSENPGKKLKLLLQNPQSLIGQQKTEKPNFNDKNKGFLTNLQVPKINTIHNFRQQVSMQIEQDQREEFLNEEDGDLVPLSNPNYRKSCTQMENMKLLSNKYLAMNMKQTKNRFFMTNLSKTEEDELQSEFQRIFLSRRINMDEDLSENEELKRQFMFLLG